MAQAKTPLRTESLVEILGLVVLLAFVAAHATMLRDPGIGWHLRTGEWILRHRAIPHFDPFLAATAGKIWICNQWLSDLILWILFALGGGAALQAFAFCGCLLPYIILAPRWARTHDCSAPAMCIGLLLAMGLGAVQWYVRPMMFSFLLFALTYKLLMDIIGRRNIGRSFVILPCVFAVWANLHPAFPLGLLLIACCLADQICRFGAASRPSMNIIALFFLCLAATLINPFGLELHRSAFGLISNDYFMNLNTEWLSPNFHNPVFYPLVLVLTVCCAAPLARPALSIFERLVFAIFIVAALRSGRYAPFLGIAAVTPLITSMHGFFLCLRRWNFSRALTAFTDPAVRSRLPLGVVTAVFGVLLLGFAAVSRSLPGWPIAALNLDQKFPKQVVDLLAAAPADTKIFHTPDWGGFITFTLWPKQRASIDDRNELNGQAAYEDFLSVAKVRPKWRETLTRGNFRYLLVQKSEPLYSALQLIPEWRSNFEDDSMAVFERSSPPVESRKD